jgi:hypothetical protein
MPAKLVRQDADSTESRIVPYESLNDLQEKITGETLPGVVFEICDSCDWCATCINEKGVKVACPGCGKLTSKIPMALDEICLFEKDEKRGVTLRFARKLPLR